MGGYHFVKETPGDKVLNRGVRAVLLLRGSKALFSEERRVRKEIEKKLGRQDAPKLPKKFGCACEVMKVRGRDCLVLTPPAGDKKKALVFLTGGAFMREPTALHYRLCERLCVTAGVKVVLPMYPKTPTYDYRDTRTMLLTLMEALYERCAPEDVSVAGDSAGGTIALSLCGWLRKASLPQPGRLLLICPCTEITVRRYDPAVLADDPMLGIDGLRLLTRCWCGEQDVYDEAVNPAFCDCRGFPETVIFAGAGDMLTVGTEDFYRLNRDIFDISLYIYEGMYHDFPLFALNASRQVLRHIAHAVVDSMPAGHTA